MALVGRGRFSYTFYHSFPLPFLCPTLSSTIYILQRILSVCRHPSSPLSSAYISHYDPYPILIHYMYIWILILWSLSKPCRAVCACCTRIYIYVYIYIYALNILHHITNSQYANLKMFGENSVLYSNYILLSIRLASSCHFFLSSYFGISFSDSWCAFIFVCYVCCWFNSV